MHFFFKFKHQLPNIKAVNQMEQQARQGDREQWKVTRAPGEHAGWLVWVGWAVGVLLSKFELALLRTGVIYRVWL